MDVLRERLANQLLTGGGAPSAAAAVKALGAVQAQDYAGAKWAVSLRAGHIADALIEQEIDAGRILRTHVLRPTWHFVTPDDIRWMLGLTGPRIARAMASYNRKLELTPVVFRKARRLIEKALAGGQYRTRAELRVELQRGGIGQLATQRLGHVMMQAEIDGLVCSGPRRGRESTYALLDERAPLPAAIDRDEALSRLAQRYFATRGPASLKDFAWWSGLTMADGRRGIEANDGSIVEVTVGGTAMWQQPRGTPASRRTGTTLLLPNYDEFFIGYKDRSAVAGRIRSTGLVTGGDALVANVIFMDGELVGGWRRRLERDEVVVRVNIVARLRPAEEKRLARAVAAYGRFLGTTGRMEHD